MVFEIVGVERSERKRVERRGEMATETETMTHFTHDVRGREEENNNHSDTRWPGRCRLC